MQHPDYAIEEIRRVAALGCRVALVRPMDAMGNYPLQPKYEPVWDALEETGMVYGMHPFPAFGSSKPSGYSEQYSGAELIRKTIATAGLPHSFLTNVQNFQAEAALWVTMVLMSGFFERHPKINAAVFEASSTWLSFLIDECDKAYRLYRNERQLPPLKRLPSETFFEHCMTGFEGDEAPPARLPGVLWRHPVLVVRRLSPRRRRRLAGDRDDAEIRSAEGGSGQVPRRQRPPALQGAGAGQTSSATASPRSSAPTGGRPRKKSAPRCGRRRRSAEWPPDRHAAPDSGGRDGRARISRCSTATATSSSRRALGEVP